MRTSVIIPCYNYGSFLGEAIRSVQRQAITDLEIIVVDDGSTDNTPEVVGSIGDRRVCYVRTTHRGISAARNEGLSLARGEFIAFLDADDRWRPEKLSRQLAVMEAEPDIGGVFANFVRFDETRIYPRDQFSFYPELADVPTRPTMAGGGYRVLANAFETFVLFTEFPTWVQTILFRAGAIEGLRFADGQAGSARLDVCEDTHFVLRAYERAPVAYIETPLVEVRRHGHNVTQNLDVLPRARLDMLHLLYTEPHSRAARRALRRRIGRAWVNVGRSQLHHGEVRQAFVSLIKGLRYRGYQHAAAKSLLLFPFSAPVSLLKRRRIHH